MNTVTTTSALTMDDDRRYDHVHIPISTKSDLAYYDRALERMGDEIMPENRRTLRDSVKGEHVTWFLTGALAMKWMSWLIRQGIECTYRFEYPVEQRKEKPRPMTVLIRKGATLVEIVAPGQQAQLLRMTVSATADATQLPGQDVWEVRYDKRYWTVEGKFVERLG